MNQNWTQRTGHEKYPTCAIPRTTVSSVLLYGDPFSIYCTFKLTPMLKFESATKFFKLGWLPFPYGTQCPHKDWRRSDEKCRSNSFLKFLAPYGPVITKLSKFHKSLVLIFGRPQNIYNFIFPHEYLPNVWLRSDKNVGNALKFLLP